MEESQLPVEVLQISPQQRPLHPTSRTGKLGAPLQIDPSARRRDRAPERGGGQRGGRFG